MEVAYFFKLLFNFSHCVLFVRQFGKEVTAAFSAKRYAEKKTVITILFLKSQVVYSKQPKLGLTQEFVVDCAHALWVVRSIKRLVSLMLMK